MEKVYFFWSNLPIPDFKLETIISLAPSIFTFLLVLIGAWHISVIIRANKQENRAYVGVTGFKLYCQESKDREGKPIELKAGTIIQNYVCITVENGGEDLPEKFTFSDFNTYAQEEARPIASTTMLLPGKSIPFSSPIDYNIIIKAKSKEVNLYIYGHIEYLDVFKNKRSSSFCALYVHNDLNETMDSFCIYGKNNEFT